MGVVVLKLSALGSEAGLNPHTLKAKIRHETPLTATETSALVAAIKHFRLAAFACRGNRRRDEWMR